LFGASPTVVAEIRKEETLALVDSTLRADVFEHSWLAPPGTESYVRITSPSVPISNELMSEIFAEINKHYPNIIMSGDTSGNTSSFNLFFKEPTAISSVRDIVSIIEKKAGITGVNAKIMRVTSRFST
jgi:hypothetical protein